MMKRHVLFLLLLTSTLYADDGDVAATDAHPEPVLTPEEIEAQINQEQRDFEIAKEMFIPWYTGPLITGSANNVPPGYLNLQPYLYLTTNYAQFTKNRRSKSTPNTFIVSPLLLIETGITDWLDVTVIPQAFFRWQKQHFAENFADLPLQFGFQLAKETPYIPSIRFIVGELFPTGKYQHLNPKKLGLDATGEGAFQTTVGLNVSKVFWWLKLHPISVRLASNCNIADHRVSVRDFNAFGGGDNTKGKVKVGTTYNIDLGVEVSLTEKWVYATDIAYTYSNKSTFRGRAGESAPGVQAANGVPSSDQLSIAPAIEYNVNDVSGFIGGGWFAVTGRNSPNFASVIISYTILF